MPDEKIIISMPYYNFVTGTGANMMVCLRLDPRTIAHYFILGQPSGEARNEAIVHSLPCADWTHMMFVDADQGLLCEPDQLIDGLLACDADVACGWYDLKLGDGYQSGIVRSVQVEGESWMTGEMPKDIFDITGCGAGCLLVRREVFDTTLPPWFKWEGDYLSDPNRVSDDMYFCNKVLQHGFTMRCNPAMKVDHDKQMSLHQIVGSFRQAVLQGA